MRLYFDGAVSTRDAKAAWDAEPAERRGARPITTESLTECMPGGVQMESGAVWCERLETLCAAFNDPPFASAPRSHVTVNALRTRCWELWGETCEGLGSVAEGLAFHWFIDLLFVEVGRDTPFASIDAAALALADTEAADSAATAVVEALRRKAAKSGFADLLAVLRLSNLGAPDEVLASRLGIPRAEAVRLKLAARSIVDKVWTARRLLPNQLAMAEDRLMDALPGHDLAATAEGD
jgi:hypothetical protein